jgi:Arc/MetJ-type ribon-helix-helix transcriptional regulator
MSNAAKRIELPEDLQAFAEELVRAGQYATIADVVRDALERQKVAILREALDVGIADLETGAFVEATPEELAKGIRAKRSFDNMR